MQRPDPNLPHLLAIAGALGELRERMVFVGGSIAGLLLTDPLAEGVRPTLDVDAVVEADGWLNFHRVEEQIEQRGFVRDAASGVICRWKHRASGIPFDLMPVDSNVLGFSNRWYGEAVTTAQPMQLADGIVIRMVAAPAFVATKLEAFLGRGQGDYLASHDLEDVLNVVDGRDELPNELQHASMPLRDFVAKTFAGLLAKSDFINCLPGLIADGSRADLITERLRRITAQD
ncbi:hypothetical protein QFW77_01685 [Luteimonas sp. RD2P54]|uniref:Nucleotidyl transferase AbiEii/AbiGii toxin family protein n=1 Tax=Luteimonas endophytica TaxID=3042023 RepID=A0ABT6J578_9GAMM|nr:hypothetical protein [Luteimonas endophytica]MDH5821707.1 hypothetical protein [Luteimonas endophytica]